MERQDFLPRGALPKEGGLRDLPPLDRISSDACPLNAIATPRQEEVDVGCGCDCGCNSGHDHNGHDDLHGHGCGVCVGYEGCADGSWGLKAHPVAMVYAPCQSFLALYDPATALHRGTLFTELDLPFGCAEGAFTAIGCACQAERRGV